MIENEGWYVVYVPLNLRSHKITNWQKSKFEIYNQFITLSAFSTARSTFGIDIKSEYIECKDALLPRT